MKKILAIEDNALVVRILQQHMKNVDFSIAIHPAESVTKATEEKPDLILLDLMLPERGGMEILHDLKQNRATKDIPVIILSALGNDEEIAMAKREGAVDYIVKGMESIDVVVAKISNVIGEELNRQKTSPEFEREVTKSKNPKQSGQFKKKVVLFVEDDLFLVHAYRDILEENQSIRVWIAQDGDQALSYFSKSPPDLVLLDLMLPGKSGFEVLEAMRKDAQWKDVRVIILSNLGQPQDIERATKLGIADYIIKANTRMSDIVARIEKIVSTD